MSLQLIRKTRFFNHCFIIIIVDYNIFRCLVCFYFVLIFHRQYYQYSITPRYFDTLQASTCNSGNDNILLRGDGNLYNITNMQYGEYNNILIHHIIGYLRYNYPVAKGNFVYSFSFLLRLQKNFTSSSF